MIDRYPRPCCARIASALTRGQIDADDALVGALAPVMYDSIVLLTVLVELAPAPDKLDFAIETAADTEAATDTAWTIEVADALRLMLPADVMVDPSCRPRPCPRRR